MSKAKFAPIDWATEIDRPGIVKLSGASICKVGFITTRDKWGFPKLSRLGPKGIYVYNLAAVEAWLETNDLKNMAFTKEYRRPVREQVKAEPGIGGAELAALKIGIKRHAFKGTGQKTTVHVPERHEYIAPHPQLTRFSNNAEHRILVSF